MDSRRTVAIHWPGKTINAYGLCIYSMEKKKFLLVQRKHSISLLNILRDNYRKSELKHLIENMTKEEVKMCVEAINNKKIESLVKGVLGNEHIKYDYSSFSSLLPYFIAASEEEKSKEENEWSFPKGRVEKEENSLQCALREVEEETGIKGENLFLHAHSIKLVSKHDVYTYELFIYPAILFKDVSFELKDNIEVNKIEWFTKEEVEKKIKNFDQVYEVYKDNGVL